MSCFVIGSEVSVKMAWEAVCQPREYSAVPHFAKKCSPIPSGWAWIYLFIYWCMFLCNLIINFGIIKGRLGSDVGQPEILTGDVRVFHTHPLGLCGLYSWMSHILTWFPLMLTEYLHEFKDDHNPDRFVRPV